MTTIPTNLAISNWNTLDSWVGIAPILRTAWSRLRLCSLESPVYIAWQRTVGGYTVAPNHLNRCGCIRRHAHPFRCGRIPTHSRTQAYVQHSLKNCRIPKGWTHGGGLKRLKGLTHDTGIEISWKSGFGLTTLTQWYPALFIHFGFSQRHPRQFSRWITRTAVLAKQ